MAIKARLKTTSYCTSKQMIRLRIQFHATISLHSGSILAVCSSFIVVTRTYAWK